MDDKRIEEINNAANEYTKQQLAELNTDDEKAIKLCILGGYAFSTGAEWADTNPNQYSSPSQMIINKVLLLYHKKKYAEFLNGVDANMKDCDYIIKHWDDITAETKK